MGYYDKIRQEMKTRAEELRALKATRKSSTNGYVRNLEQLKYEYRHWHIAYCELRGRTREEIEIPGEHATPIRQSWIELYKWKLVAMLPEEAQLADG